MRSVVGRLGAAVIAAVFLTGCNGRGETRNPGPPPEYVFTYAENQARDYPTTQGAYRFAELVEKRTGGRIRILVYAEGALGDEKSVIEQLQFGGIDFARVSLSPLAEQVPEMNVLQMPYLYEGPEHMWRVLDGEIGEEFMEFLDGSGLKGLSWYDAGARSFYCTSRVIRSPKDVAGLRIRVQESELMREMVETLGGTAVPMAYDEVYSALETRRIDGAENNWPSYESVRHYEVAPCYSVNEHTRVPELQLASGYTWNQLSPEDQMILMECAKESAKHERRLWSRRSDWSRQRVENAGCRITELTLEEKAQFREALMPMYEKFCADYMDVVERIEKAGWK